MAKAVLISIRPEWCDKISRGEKTIELRKTRPNIDTPFTAYIFKTGEYIPAYVLSPYSGKRKPGQVIGEFFCTDIDRYLRVGTMQSDIEYLKVLPDYFTKPVDFDSLCMTRKQFEEYGKGRGLYGWHISNLTIYDKPKELSEFWSWQPSVEWIDGYPMPTHLIRRAPQSWMYVEELI